MSRCRNPILRAHVIDMAHLEPFCFVIQIEIGLRPLDESIDTRVGFNWIQSSCTVIDSDPMSLNTTCPYMRAECRQYYMVPILSWCAAGAVRVIGSYWIQAAGTGLT